MYLHPGSAHAEPVEGRARDRVTGWLAAPMPSPHSSHPVPGPSLPAPMSSTPPKRATHLTVTALCLGSVLTVAKHPVPTLTFGAFGVEGDRHAGELLVPRYGRLKGQTVFNERQWSAVSEEEVAELEQRLGIALPPGALGENLRVSGLPRLTKTRPGTRLRLASGAILFVSGPNLPCPRAAQALAKASGHPDVLATFMKEARGRRGLVGWVETPGGVSVGDVAAIEFG